MLGLAVLLLCNTNAALGVSTFSARGGKCARAEGGRMEKLPKLEQLRY